MPIARSGSALFCLNDGTYVVINRAFGSPSTLRQAQGGQAPEPRYAMFKCAVFPRVARKNRTQKDRQVPCCRRQ